ncbi:MAG: hypothetical protein BECKG1743D_GA0114223_104355, partial [Candidatus Kentron sp. G]
MDFYLGLVMKDDPAFAVASLLSKNIPGCLSFCLGVCRTWKLFGNSRLGGGAPIVALQGAMGAKIRTVVNYTTQFLPP